MFFKQNMVAVVKIIKRKKEAQKYEYGCDLQRLFPWKNVCNPFWGAAIASVRPNESTIAHSHNEKETFFVFSGSGVLHIDKEEEYLEFGDVAFIPEDAYHWFENTSDKKPLVFLTIFWDSPESIQGIQKKYCETSKHD